MPGAAPNMFGAPGFQGQQGGANCPSCGPQAAAHQAALTAGQDLPSQELATIHDSYNAAPQNSRYLTPTNPLIFTNEIQQTRYDRY
jgi:hypothetical protein